MKTISLRILSLLLCLSVLLPLAVSCGKTQAPETVPETVPETEAPTAAFSLADLGDAVEIHTFSQNDLWNMEDPKEIPEYYTGTQELSVPQPVSLSWTCDCNEPSGFVTYRVTVTEADNPSAVRTFETEKSTLSVFNLKIGTEYVWNVTAVYENAEYPSENASFGTVDQCPRNLYVEGITNVRDLGGYVTASGAKVRQGLMFRCGRLNQSNVDGVIPEITENGLKTLSEDLKIKTEIDLRVVGENGNLTESLIPGANYLLLPMASNKVILKDKFNYDSIVRFFEIASDEANYPLAFHCSIGTDRTGAIAYLLLMVLGVDTDIVTRDYLYSNLAMIGSSRSPATIANYQSVIRRLEGKTLNDKVYTYLLDRGVTEEQIESVRRIMLEPQG